VRPTLDSFSQASPAAEHSLAIIKTTFGNYPIIGHNSLLHKILRVTSLDPRFCEDKADTQPTTSIDSIIYGKSEKKVRDAARSLPPPNAAPPPAKI
jgi:hypothetical protein